MSNLIKNVALDLPSEVSQQSKNVYRANSSTSIRKISDMNIVVNSIHQSINRCIADKGINMSSVDIDYLYKSVREDILRDFSQLSLQDIQLCFYMGVRGKLGEYFGINAVTLYQWLQKYCDDILPQTFNEISKHLPAKKIEEPQVDFKNLDLEKIDNLYYALLKWKEEKIYDFNDIGNIHYKFLERMKVFNFSYEQKMIILEEAKTIYLSDLKNKNLDLLGQGKSIQMIDVNSIINKIEQGEKDSESVVEIYFLKSLLKHFIVNFSNKTKDIELFKTDLIKKVELEYGK
jgi:hypothetical protein